MNAMSPWVSSRVMSAIGTSTCFVRVQRFKNVKDTPPRTDRTESDRTELLSLSVNRDRARHVWKPLSYAGPPCTYLHTGARGRRGEERDSELRRRRRARREDEAVLPDRAACGSVLPPGVVRVRRV